MEQLLKRTEVQGTSRQGEAEPNPHRPGLRLVEGWIVEETQEMPKLEVEQFSKEEGNVDREDKRAGLH